MLLDSFHTYQSIRPPVVTSEAIGTWIKSTAPDDVISWKNENEK
jgi:hypothetical protein